MPKTYDAAMGSSQVQKGKRWERVVANLFAAAGWDGSKRGIGQPRAGNEVPDADVPTLWPECKAGKQTNPRAALAQAVAASAGTGRTPCAVTKDDGDPPLITMRLDDFLAMCPPPADRPEVTRLLDEDEDP